MAGAVLEGLDDGQRAAVGQLAGEHQRQPRPCRVGDGRDHAQDVLHRVAEAQAVPLAVVDQAGSPRPGEGDEAVVEAPDVDRVVQVRIGRVHHQAAQLAVPALFQPLQLDLGPRQRAVLGHGAPAQGVRVADAQHD